MRDPAHRERRYPRTASLGGLDRNRDRYNLYPHGIGISAIALNLTGSMREGIRVCVSQIADGDLDTIDRRLALFDGAQR